MKELHRTDSSLGGKGRAASGSQHSVPGLARTFSASSNNSHSNSVLGSKRDLWELGQLKPDPLPPNQPNQSDQKTRTFFDFDAAHSISQPFVRADPPIRAASVPVQPRRNDIFFMDHAVTKPVLKMTEEEVKALETHPTPAPKHYGSQSSHNPDWRSAASETFSRYDLPSPTTSSSALRNVRQSDPVEQSTPSTRTPRGFVDLDQEPSTEYSRTPPVLPTTQGFIPLRSATAPVGMDISFPITLASEKIMPITSGTILSETSNTNSKHLPPISTTLVTASPTFTSPTTQTPDPTSLQPTLPPLPDLSSLAKPNPPNLHIKFLPLRKNFLGNGRYAKVYLASYTLTTSTATSPTSSTYTPCAVKQMHASHECFDLAIKEAKVLRTLIGHPNILELIGTTSEENVGGSDDKARLSAQSRGSKHRRSRRRPSDASADGDEMDWMHSDDEDEDEGVPRMFVVLELATRGTMMDYIESMVGEGVGQDVWMKWAKQLASAIDYVHSFGYVHHDVKPHNCLLNDNLDVKLGDFGNALPVQGFQPPPPSLPLSASIQYSPITPTTPTAPIDNHLTMSPTLIPTPTTPLTRETSGISDASLTLPSPQPLSILSPIPSSFLSRFRSELSDAQSLRTSRTGSLTDGLGRGTQAYMAPEMFGTTNGKEYSYPVDIYAIGATLYVAATGIAPFSGAGSSVFMMMGIRRGFWASGMQPGIGASGPSVSGENERGKEMRRSLAAEVGGSTGLQRNRWLQPGDEVPGGEGRIKFGNGDLLDSEAVRIMCACLEGDGGVRPTGRELGVWLNMLTVV